MILAQLISWLYSLSEFSFEPSWKKYIKKIKGVIRKDSNGKFAIFFKIQSPPMPFYGKLLAIYKFWILEWMLQRQYYVYLMLHCLNLESLKEIKVLWKDDQFLKCPEASLLFSPPTHGDSFWFLINNLQIIICSLRVLLIFCFPQVWIPSFSILSSSKDLSST